MPSYLWVLTVLRVKRYTNASVYATMNLTAANFSNYWGLLEMWQIVAFYFFLPVIALAINFVGVWVREPPRLRRVPWLCVLILS